MFRFVVTLICELVLTVSDHDMSRLFHLDSRNWTTPVPSCSIAPIRLASMAVWGVGRAYDVSLVALTGDIHRERPLLVVLDPKFLFSASHKLGDALVVWLYKLDTSCRNGLVGC